MSARMKGRRWLWPAGGVAAVAVVAAGALFGPRVARDMDTFRVVQVEVTGTRFLEPYAVIEAAGLHGPANVFDDAAAWRAGILSLPLVADASIRRRLPSTLAIEVREVEPAALVAADRLRPVDAGGREVALDPAGALLDLPILSGVTLAEGRVAHEDGESALRTLALIREHQPGLAERLSQITVSADGLRLTFRDGGPDALLPVAASPVHLAQLRVAHADLAARGELSSVRQIDVRFRDQVVVSFLRSPVS